MNSQLLFSPVTLLLSFIMLMSGLPFTTYAASDIKAQRALFQQARQALETQDLATFQTYTARLKRYPLYYYLRYLQLKSQLDTVPATQIKRYLQKYGNTRYGNKLRQEWLTLAAKQGNWNTFLQSYTPQKSTTLQCYHAVARLQLRQQRQTALHDTKKLWLVGKSQPPACDAAFAALYNSPLMTESLLWQRIELAMQARQLRLATAMAKRLSPTDQIWVTRWQEMHRSPAKVLANLDYPDTALARKVIKHGIVRLAKQAEQFDLAQQYWQQYQRQYAFSTQALGETERELALAAARHYHEHAMLLLTAVHKDFLNEDVTNRRIKTALHRQEWRAVADFITELPKTERSNLQWRYWYARALQQMGKTRAAKKLFQSLAKERDYYGFLAADQLQVPYQMQHKEINPTSQERRQLLQLTSVQAAKEFLAVGMVTDARREWYYITQQLPLRQKAVAASIAREWRWYDRAIFTAAKAKAYDDLEVRFPLAYHSYLKNAARQQNVDLSWVYGIVRQESAFMADARSHAGALGLMQLMPATGRMMARKLGIELERTSDILDIKTNVSLGTGYLRQMLDTFDGNYMLATAAYNAGPGRPKRWIQSYQCVPADVWVELIPFKETRSYVRRVMFYTSLFDARLGRKVRPLRLALEQDKTCRLKTADNTQQQQVFLR